MRPLTVSDGDRTVTIHAGGPRGDDPSLCTLTCSVAGRRQNGCALPHLTPMPADVAWFHADRHLADARPSRPVLNNP